MKTFFGKRSGSGAATAWKVGVKLVLGAIVVWLVMLLWNWLLPSLFAGARTMDYWQTLGLIVLCRVLFGGGGGGGRWRAHRRWHHMSEDERAQFQQRFQGRRGCGQTPAADAAGDQAP